MSPTPAETGQDRRGCTSRCGTVRGAGSHHRDPHRGRVPYRELVSRGTVKQDLNTKAHCLQGERCQSDNAMDLSGLEPPNARCARPVRFRRWQRTDNRSLRNRPKQLELVTVKKPAFAAVFQSHRNPPRCRARALNPKVAGSIPARPIVFALATSPPVVQTAAHTQVGFGGEAYEQRDRA